MLVAKRMRKVVYTLNPLDPIQRAAEMFARHDIRHAPVVEDPEKVLVGMLAERDLRGTPGEAWHQKLTGQAGLSPSSPVRVGDLMTTAVVTVTSHATVEKAALLLLDNQIESLPVVDDEGVLIGTLSRSDLLEVFVEVMGIGVPSARIEVRAGEGGERLSKAVELIHRAGGQVLSIVSIRDTDSGERILFIRLEDRELEPILSALESAGIEVLSAEEHEPG